MSPLPRGCPIGSIQHRSPGGFKALLRGEVVTMATRAVQGTANAVPLRDMVGATASRGLCPLSAVPLRNMVGATASRGLCPCSAPSMCRRGNCKAKDPKSVSWGQLHGPTQWQKIDVS